MKYTDSDIQTLATIFTRIILEVYTENEMDEIIRRNHAETDKNVCHTHDFGDANESMLQAFSEVHGREPHISNHDDMELINAAWAQAKLSDFDVKPRENCS
jgi:hypothetical protein